MNKIATQRTYRKLFHNLGLLSLSLFIVMLTATSCDNNNSDNPLPLFISQPSIQMDPNGTTPLAGVLTVETNKKTRISLFIAFDGRSFTVEFDQFSKTHSLIVLGFRSDTAHTIEVTAIDKNGNETFTEDPLDVTTPPLPVDFPDITVITNPLLVESGVILFEAKGFLIAINGTGEIVWYHRIQFGGGPDRDLRRMANGNLLLLLPKFRMIELDMLGNTVRKWHAAQIFEGEEDSIPVDTIAFHHEAFEMENGNFLVLGVDLRVVENYPTSETDPFAPTATADVGEDIVIEFRPDGTIVNEWSLLDLLDPLRIGYNSLFDQNGFAALYPDVVGVIRDWAHANAVIHDTSDDSIVVSLRHQDAVVKFSRKTGELIWILGPHANWTVEFDDFLFNPTNDSEFFWSYHQHAPVFTPEGTILFYDNGNFRASPFDPKLPNDENFSRAVEYIIDEETMDITLVWEFGQFAEPTLFTPFIGDADYMPETGNILITFGGLVAPRLSARIIEVTHETPAEKVLEIFVADSIVYRSEKLPSLYPDSQM